MRFAADPEPTGASRSDAGFSTIHLRFTQKLKKPFSRSSFFAFARTLSLPAAIELVHVHRAKLVNHRVPLGVRESAKLLDESFVLAERGSPDVTRDAIGEVRVGHESDRRRGLSRGSLSRNGRRNHRRVLVFFIPAPGKFPCCLDPLRLRPSRLLGVAAAELARQSAVRVDRTMTLLQGAAEFVGLVVSRVRIMAACALVSCSKMSAIEVEGQGPSTRTLELHCPPLPTESAVNR